MSAHRGVGTELGEVQQGPIGTDAVGDRLGQLDHWGPLVLALGTSKTGERRYLIDLLETLPQAVLQSVLLVCDAGYVGYDLFGLLLKQQCSFLIRLSPHELPRLVRSVGRLRGGCFWLESWTTPTIPPDPQYREPMPEDLVSQRCA